jgi:hypothetical protein
MFVGLFQAADISFFCRTSRLVLGPTQPPIEWVSRAVSPGAKWLVCEAERSPPSSDEVKNGGTQPPLFLTPLWCSAQLVKHKENVSLYNHSKQYQHYARNHSGLEFATYPQWERWIHFNLQLWLCILFANHVAMTFLIEIYSYSVSEYQQYASTLIFVCV